MSSFHDTHIPHGMMTDLEKLYHHHNKIYFLPTTNLNISSLPITFLAFDLLAERPLLIISSSLSLTPSLAGYLYTCHCLRQRNITNEGHKLITANICKLSGLQHKCHQMLMTNPKHMDMMLFS